MKKLHKKYYSTGVIMVMLLVAFILLGCQQNTPEDDQEETAPQTNTEENVNEVSDSKPEVAEIKENNEPNRIITSFNGDTRTQMGFNWYTTKLFDDAQIWVSTSEDLSDAIVFDAEATEVTSRYAERTEEGYFIFADVEMDDEENPIEDENGNILI